MNELKVFPNREFGNIRATEIDGEPWFIGKDVAIALGYKDTKSALQDHVDQDDKRILKGGDLPPLENHIPKTVFPVDFVAADIPNRGLTFINESGIYSLIFGSKLPKAKEFKRWVTSEVLPSIRKTGSYSMDIPQDYPSALRALADKCEENQRLEAKIALDAPKTRFADCVADSHELSYVSELAKVLKQNGVDIGRTRVFEWLREHEYIMKTGSKYNEPTQKAMNRKLFHVVKDRFGNAITKMTQKGFIVLLNEIMDDYTGQNQMAII